MVDFLQQYVTEKPGKHLGKLQHRKQHILRAPGGTENIAQIEAVLKVLLLQTEFLNKFYFYGLETNKRSTNNYENIQQVRKDITSIQTTFMTQCALNHIDTSEMASKANDLSMLLAYRLDQYTYTPKKTSIDFGTQFSPYNVFENFVFLECRSSCLSETLGPSHSHELFFANFTDDTCADIATDLFFTAKNHDNLTVAIDITSWGEQTPKYQAKCNKVKKTLFRDSFTFPNQITHKKILSFGPIQKIFMAYMTTYTKLLLSGNQQITTENIHTETFRLLTPQQQEELKMFFEKFLKGLRFGLSR